MSELEPGMDLAKLSRADRLTYHLFMQHIRENQIVRASLGIGFLALAFRVGPPRGALYVISGFVAAVAFALMALGIVVEACLRRRIARLDAQEDTEMEQDFEAEVRRRIGNRLIGGLRAANADPDKR
jgi:hypothetical protein